MGTLHEHRSSCAQRQKETISSLEVFVSYPPWMLGNKLLSSARAAHVLTTESPLQTQEKSLKLSSDCCS